MRNKNTEVIQLSKPYQSTIKFKNFFIKNNFLNKILKKILNVGVELAPIYNIFQNIFLVFILLDGTILSHKLEKQRK